MAHLLGEVLKTQSMIIMLLARMHPKEPAVGGPDEVVKTVIGYPLSAEDAAVARVTAPGLRRGLGCQLTPRELEVVRELAEGKSNRLIARTLCISERTVKVHLKTVFSKLQVASRTEAVLSALRLGLVETGR
ncbi:response regulator transcription factor [Amycolatopsis sp. NPDC051128]|uniref:response regulator transcription factor n=1 Tax=Amycolatopsis sp. NPDC051128 TaxID=3155412 RepID=UPI0034206500